MTFEEAFKAYMVVSGTERSAAYQDELMLKFFSRSFGRNTDIRDISPRLLSRALAALRDKRITRGGIRVPLSHGTLNRHTQFLQRVLNHALALGEPVQNIRWKAFIAVEPERTIHPLSKEEELYVISNIDPAVRPVFCFSVLTGVRLRNAISLRWDMIDWKEGRISFRGKSKRPGGKTYLIPLTTAAIQILKDQEGRHDVFVFTFKAKANDRYGHQKDKLYPITEHVIRYYWELVDLKKRWHDVRHTFGTRLYRISKDIHLVQRAMNHSDINTTLRYVHTDQEDIRKAMEQLSPLSPPPFTDMNESSSKTELAQEKEQKSNIIKFQQKQRGAAGETRTPTLLSASTSTGRVPGGDTPYSRGWLEAESGKTLKDNPYNHSTGWNRLWMCGWYDYHFNKDLPPTTDQEI